MEVTLTAVTRVDSSGVRTWLLDGEPMRYTLHLTRVAGQWRIADPPDMVVISQATFDLLWTPVRIAYLDPTRTTLEGDLRWFVQARAVDRVAQALGGAPL